MSKWVVMRTGSRTAILKMLSSKLAIALDVIISQSHEDGTWISTESSREYIMQKAGVSPPTLFRYLKTFKDRGILLPVERSEKGVYKFNPDMIRMLKDGR